jgi:hypothetical protein
MKLTSINNPWGGPFIAKSRLFLEHIAVPDEVAVICKLAKDNNIVLVLIGANAVNAYSGKPRASQDVDFVCDKPKKLITLIKKTIAKKISLEIKENAVVFRLSKNGEEFLDIIKPYNELLKIALSKTKRVREFSIPIIEVVVALKYAAMISPHRQQDDQLQDAVDFSRIVRNNPGLNIKKTIEYASSVHETAADEIKKFIADIRAGKRLNI